MMNSNTEIWRDVEGYEGFYQASNFGRIRSLTSQNRYKRYSRIKILNPALSKDGYLRVVLCVDRKMKSLNVHRLVLSAFSMSNDNLQVNHIDGNKSNNSLSNLEWCTQSENMLHAYKLGLEKPCDNGLKKNVSLVKDGTSVGNYKSIREMCRVHLLDRRAVQRVIDGTYLSHKGFTFKINP